MKILLAIDSSGYSEAIVSLIQALDIQPKPAVSIMTVIPEHIFLGERTLADLLGRSATLKTETRKEEKALQLLSQAEESLGAGRLDVETLVRRGHPADEIIKACHDVQADLAVVGSKGASDAPEFLLGSTAHKVIKYAPCSVLVVKKKIETVKRVLVPLDGSKYSDKVVQFLLQLPLPHSTEVLLITVVQSFAAAFVKTYTLDIERDREIIANLQKSEEKAAEKLIAEAGNRFHRGGYRVSAVIARGDPSQEILRYTARQNVDLIALGAKGLTGIRSFLLGSVAQRIARYAAASVLIVR